jgi:hypothetical protein
MQWYFQTSPSSKYRKPDAPRQARQARQASLIKRHTPSTLKTTSGKGLSVAKDALAGCICTRCSRDYISRTLNSEPHDATRGIQGPHMHGNLAQGIRMSATLITP